MLEVAAAANADMSAVAPGIRVEGQIDDGGHLHVVVAKKAVVHVGGVMIDDAAAVVELVGPVCIT